MGPRKPPKHAGGENKVLSYRSLLWLTAPVAVIALGCVTPVSPGKFDIPDGAVHSIEGGPVDLLGPLAFNREREVSIPGGKASVDEDEYTTAVVKRLAEQLRAHGVRVEPGANRVIEIRVVRVSIQPQPTFTCVIDFNRRLGDGPVQGLQSRAESWNFQKSCSAATAQVVIDILNDPTTLDFLKGS